MVVYDIELAVMKRECNRVTAQANMDRKVKP